MASTADPDTSLLDMKPKQSKKATLAALAAALFLGSGGYVAGSQGIVKIPFIGADAPSSIGRDGDVRTAYLALEPITFDLGNAYENRSLRVLAQLEILPENAEMVSHQIPRVMDALNTFLRSIDPKDVAEPSVFPWLRTQMMHRIEVALGPGMVEDILVLEFMIGQR